eukprot:sb/3473554/
MDFQVFHQEPNLKILTQPDVKRNSIFVIAGCRNTLLIAFHTATSHLRLFQRLKDARDMKQDRKCLKKINRSKKKYARARKILMTKTFQKSVTDIWTWEDIPLLEISYKVKLESIRTLTSSDFSETSHILKYDNGGTNTAYFRSEKVLVR